MCVVDSWINVKVYQVHQLQWRFGLMGAEDVVVLLLEMLLHLQSGNK